MAINPNCLDKALHGVTIVKILLSALASLLLLLTVTTWSCAADPAVPTADSPALTSAEAKPSDAPKLDNGDSAWMLVSTGLVLFMVPGLALFYGGMVRRKNVLGTM